MNFLEKDLEEIIFNADRPHLSDRGLYISGKLYRQLKIGNYGVADLVLFDREYDANHYVKKIISPILAVTVFELKKDKIGISAFLQALGYIKGIQRYLELKKFKFEVIYNIKLIGRNIDINSTFSYLCDLIPPNPDYSSFLECFTYDYSVDGITFENKLGYNLINEGF